CDGQHHRGVERQVLAERGAGKGRVDDERDRGPEEHHERGDGPVDVLPEEIEDAPRTGGEGDLAMRDRVLDDVWKVGDAPRPSARLEVLAGEGAPVGLGADRVAVDRNEEGYRPEAIAIGEVALPVEAAVLRDRIGGPVADLVDHVECRRIAAEAL